MGTPDPFLMNSIAEVIVKAAITSVVSIGIIALVVILWVLVGSIFGRGKK